MKKPESPLAKLSAINSKIINWILKPFIDPTRWAEYARRLKKIDVLIAEADSTWAKYARKAIPYTFEKAAKDVEDYMRKIEIERRSPPKWQAKTQRALTEQAIIDVSGGLQNGRKDIEKYFRLSQTSAASEINNNPVLKGRLRSGFIPTKQQKLSEAEISDMLREGLQDKGTPKGIQSSLEKKLRERFADEQVITIITKSGKPRTYSIETYAEIVARTRTREAQSMGTIATMQEFGQDLVRVSDHDTTTPICIPHEGKIYSISGDSKEYPKLEEIAPFHPNCMHSLGPYVASRPGSERQKVIDEQIRTVEERNKQKLKFLEEGGKFEKPERLRKKEGPDIVGNLRKPDIFLKRPRKDQEPRAPKEKLPKPPKEPKLPPPPKPVDPEIVKRFMENPRDYANLNHKDIARIPIDSPEVMNAKLAYYQTEWIHGSGRRASTAMRVATANVFPTAPAHKAHPFNYSAVELADAEAVVKEMYGRTQKEIIDSYPDGKIPLFRGVKTPVDSGDYASSSLESWTSSQETATYFVKRSLRGDEGKVGRLLNEDIDTSSILNWSGSSMWQNGEWGEQNEFIVMGL